MQFGLRDVSCVSEHGQDFRGIEVARADTEPASAPAHAASGDVIDMKEFIERMKRANAAIKTPELEKVTNELYDLLEKMDAGFGAFVYKGMLFTTFPPFEPEQGYCLVAAQINSLSKAYKKSPAVIMAEINDAIKEIKMWG